MPYPSETFGELYIGGAGVFKGYVQQPELTVRVLIKHAEHGTLYKTGDLVRLQPDGNLAYIGRADFQVKINGQRLELGEIEVTIMKHPRAVSAVVVKHEEKGRAMLVAYTAIRDLKTDEHSHIKAGLTALCKKSLPSFMVPSAWALLDRVPLNGNGNVDRKQLPTPNLKADPAAAVAPRNDLEKLLHQVFSSVLQRPELSVNDDFFAVGGSSLLAVTLLARLRSSIPALSSLTIATLFANSSVASLATLAQSQVSLPTTASAWPQLHLSSGRASAAQQRVYLDTQMRLQQRMGDSALSMYNVPVCFRIRGDIDAKRLAACLTAVVARHESLRTVIQLDGSGNLVQLVKPPADALQLELFTAKSEAELQRVVTAFAHKPFDLSSGLNLRGGLVSHQREHVIVCCAHHAFFDGWSLKILVQELTALYAARALPPLPLQYLDYAEQEHKWMQSTEFKSSLQWWKRNLAGADSLLTELPLDRPRSSTAVFDTKTSHQPVTVVLPSSLCEAIGKWQAESKTTLFMTMMACLQLHLADRRAWRASEDLAGAIFNVSRQSRPRALHGKHVCCGFC